MQLNGGRGGIGMAMGYDMYQRQQQQLLPLQHMHHHQLQQQHHPQGQLQQHMLMQPFPAGLRN